jgi:hypothetical protein
VLVALDLHPIVMQCSGVAWASSFVLSLLNSLGGKPHVSSRDLANCLKQEYQPHLNIIQNNK